MKGDTPATTNLIPPTEGIGDAVHAATRMLMGVVPVVGGTAVEVLNLILAPPVQKHLATWREDLAMRLIDLIWQVAEVERGMSDLQDRETAVRAELDRLQANDQFIATTLEATRIAAVTRSQAKLDALRNAVLNVAVGINVDEIERQLFLRYVDELTEAHLLVLRFAGGLLESNIDSENDRNHYQHMISRAIPNLADRKPLRLQIWQDLLSRGIVKNLDGSLSAIPPGMFGETWVEPFGMAFLEFISCLSSAPNRPRGSSHET